MGRPQLHYHNAMPVTPTNCFICKNTWLGRGPICDSCNPAAPPQTCTFCGSPSHGLDNCLEAQLNAQKPYSYYNSPSMTIRRLRRSKPYTNYYYSPQQPKLKYCQNCKQNAQVEAKAGTVCSNCKFVTHNPCRNCDSIATHGLSGDNMQFIECNDCQFIE